MPLNVLRDMAGPDRTPIGTWRLGVVLAAVAGAANAGGFLAVGYYTSHVTGILSAMADHAALGLLHLTLAGMVAILCFGAGAATAAILINWGRRRGLHSQLALPIMLEAGLLLVFGLLGAHLGAYHWWYVPVTVLLLCYVMGLQNALITKASRAEIRTTHVTGIVTDLGIECGKWMYWNVGAGVDKVRADRRRMRRLGALLAAFFAGGVVGAIGFTRVGFVVTVPLAGVLLLLAAVPLWDDAARAWQTRR